MNTLKLLKNAQDMRALFHQIEGTKRFAFTLEAIRNGGKLYDAASQLLEQYTYSTDTAYEFLVISLEQIIEVIENEEVTSKEEIEEHLTQYIDSAADIETTYTSDVMDWLRDNYDALDDLVEEMGNTVYENGIVRAAITTYAFTLEIFAKEVLTKLIEVML